MSCNQCSNVFEDSLALKRHLSIKHFNYSPYLCKICKKMGQLVYTAIEEDMDRHFETVHPGTEQRIILSKKKDIDDKINAAIEEIRVSTSHNISCDFKSDLHRSAMASGSTSTLVAQEQKNAEMTENYETIDGVSATESDLSNNETNEIISANKDDDYHCRKHLEKQFNVADDIDTLYESGTRTSMASKGISLDFKCALRQVYNVLYDESTVGLPPKKRESILPHAIQTQIDREITEHPGEDKQQFPQSGSNALLSKRTQESPMKSNNRAMLAMESNLSNDDAPICGLPELKSFERLPKISTTPTTRSKLISITVGDEDLYEIDSIEPAIKPFSQNSSNNSVAKLIQRKRTFSQNDRDIRTEPSSKRSNPKKVNDTEKRYKCYHCTYASAWKANLNIHVRNHTGEKPFKCGHCFYACAVKNALDIHLRTHTGEKPHKCDKCQYASTQSGALKAHMRIHTREKPFKCDKCSYACTQSGTLKAHMRIHTREKPFKCSYCSYACTSSGNLNKHIRTHTGEKPYKCSECSYAAIWIGQLQSHVRNNHSKKMK